ncbi:MAG TPA: hypothetical protein VJ485_02830, partial [archaeon]|nr:hypothetical protein [archaeon]
AAASMMNMVVIVIILTVVFSTLMAKFAASKRFTAGQKSIVGFKRESVEKEEEELEDEIEHQDEKPEASPEVQTKSAEDESLAKDPRTNRRKGKSRNSH